MFRKSKKFIAMALAVAMMMSMSTSVFAVEEESSQTKYTMYDPETGEVSEEVNTQASLRQNNYTLPSEGLGFDGIEPIEVPFVEETYDYGIQNNSTPYGYDNSWTNVTNPTAFPYRAIAQLEITFPTLGVKKGSGFVTHDGRVLTAAHCIYDVKGEWATSIKLYFGRNGSTSYKTTNATKFWVNNNWLSTLAIEDDYGVLEIPKTVTDLTGKFGMYSGVFGSQVYTLTGYPNAGIYTNKNKMYTDSGTVSAIYDGYTELLLDSTFGVSGSPLYGSNNYAVGIYTRAYDESDPQGGLATNITPAVIDLVKYVW